MRPETRFDRDYVDSLLAPNRSEFGRSGTISTREDMVALPIEEFTAELPLPDFAVCMLTKDLALVTHRSEIRFGDELLTTDRCSVWRRDPDERLLLEFHQGTPVEPPPDPTTRRPAS